MAIGDIFKLAAVSRFGPGQQCVNSWHYKQIFALPAGTPQAELVAEWQIQVQAAYLEIMSSAQVLDQLEVRQVFGGLAALDFPVGESGTGGALNTLPPMDCALLSWRTGLIGRANRGRTYLPAPFESFQDQGALTEPAIAVYQALGDLMITLNDSVTGLIPTFQMVIFHTNDGDSPEVEQVLMRNLIATQRRRRAGHGS